MEERWHQTACQSLVARVEGLGYSGQEEVGLLIPEQESIVVREHHMRQ